MEICKNEIFQVTNDSGRIISGNIRLPAKRQNLPLVFILHGFKGFKDWGFIPYVAGCLASAGAITVTFNFSMNGIDGSSDYVARPDDFADNTISCQLADAEKVILYICNSKILEFDNIWDGRTFLLGHSLGGAVSLLVGNRLPGIDRIALWGAISTFDRYTARQKKQWREKGFLEFVNMKTNQVLKLNVSYLDDFEMHQAELDLEGAASMYPKPILIVHGAQDMTVPVKEAELIAGSYLGNPQPGKELSKKIINNTGHTFGIIHPFQSSNTFLDEAVKSTIDFFELK